MSPETLRFLYELLCNQSIQIGSPDFDNVMIIASKAKAELIAAMEGNDDKKFAKGFGEAKELDVEVT